MKQITILIGSKKSVKNIIKQDLLEKYDWIDRHGTGMYDLKIMESVSANDVIDTIICLTDITKKEISRIINLCERFKDTNAETVLTSEFDLPEFHTAEIFKDARILILKDI